MDQARFWTEPEREERKNLGSSLGSATNLLCDLGKSFVFFWVLVCFVINHRKRNL